MATLTTTVSTVLPKWDCLVGTNVSFATTSATYVTETQLGSMASMPANTRINWNLVPWKTTSTAAGDGARVCDSTGTYTYGSITDANFATTSGANWVNASWKGEHGNNGTVTIELQLKSGNGTAMNNYHGALYNNITYVAQNPTDSEHIHPNILIIGSKPDQGTSNSNTSLFKLPLKYNVTEINYGYITGSHVSYGGGSWGFSVVGGMYTSCLNYKSPNNTAGWRYNDGVRGNMSKAQGFKPENVITDGIQVTLKNNINIWDYGYGVTSPTYSQYGTDVSTNYCIIAFTGTKVVLT